VQDEVNLWEIKEDEADGIKKEKLN